MFRKKLLLFILILLLIPALAWAWGVAIIGGGVPGVSTEPDNYFRWQMGSSSVISSTGSDVTVRWGIGSINIWHKN